MSIKHLKDLTMPDGIRTEKVQPSDWIADHVVTDIVATTLTLTAGAVTYGANDSGGTGYRLLLVPNA